MKDLFEELCKGCNAKALYDEEYCDACTLKDDIAEHDAKIRVDAIDELVAECERFKKQYKTFYLQDLVDISRKMKEQKE